MSNRRFGVGLSLTVLGFSAGTALAAPITFNTALPVGKGEFVNRELLVLTRSGDDNESDALGRLPIPLHSGTGSWDGFGGVVATYQTLAFQVDAQASYTAKSEANDFEGGDEARLDGSFQYRLLPRTLGKGTPGFLYGVLEANVIYRDENRSFGSPDRNSGGTSIFLTPGLQYVTKRYILEGSVQLPVSQNLNGDALENDYVVRVGFRWNF